MRHPRLRQFRGQAIAEMVIGLVGMAALLLGLIAVFQLGEANVESHLEARSAVAGQLASGSDATVTPSYLGQWNDGRDGLRFTADDGRSSWGGSMNDIAEFTDELAVVSADGIFDLSTPPLFNNEFSPRANSLVGVIAFHGATRGRTIRLDDGLRRLLNRDRGTVHVEDDAYFPHLDLAPMGSGGDAQ